MKIRPLHVALASALIIPTFGGCRTLQEFSKLRPDGLATPLADYLPIRGEVITGDRPIAVDVENMNGSVTVRVDDHYEQASVYARVNWRGKYSKEERDQLKNEDWVSAEHVMQGDRSILRVLSKDAPETEAVTSITIFMPSCDGVSIRNAGGPVLVVGAGGEHTIQSGFENGPGGRIEVRTDRPISDPINLRTSDGDVNLVIAPNSQGSFDLMSDNGHASFSAKWGKTTNVKVERTHWSGVWNEGGNPITLSTLDGNARVEVAQNPEMFTTGLH